MHIAVDPHGGSRIVGVAAEGNERDVAPLGALADRSHAGDVRVLPRPGGNLSRDLGIVKIFFAKHISPCESLGGRHYALRRARRAANRQMPAATETLRLSTVPSSGMPTMRSQSSR